MRLLSHDRYCAKCGQRAIAIPPAWVGLGSSRVQCNSCATPYWMNGQFNTIFGLIHTTNFFALPVLVVLAGSLWMRTLCLIVYVASIFGLGGLRRALVPLHKGPQQGLVVAALGFGDSIVTAFFCTFAVVSASAAPMLALYCIWAFELIVIVRWAKYREATLVDGATR